MFVTQVIVMLSRTSSRVRLSTGLPVERLRDVLEAVGVVVEHPGGEGDRRIGEAVQRLRAVPHLERVPDALREEEAQPVVGALLVRGQAGRRRVPGPEHVGGRAPWRRRAATVPGMLEWMPSSSGGALRADHVGDLGAPVAALRDVARVAEAPHQDDPGVGDVDRAPAGGRRLARVPVAGHRGDHHVEGVLRGAAVGRRVGERADDVEHLDDRAGPAVRDDQRQRVRVRRPDVDEVDVEAVDLGQELRERVQPRRQPAEVVVIGPVASELPGRREGHALGQVGDRLLLGPARRAEPLAEVVDVRLGHLDPEGPDGVRVAGCSIRGGCDVRHPGPPAGHGGGSRGTDYSAWRQALPVERVHRRVEHPVPERRPVEVDAVSSAGIRP